MKEITRQVKSLKTLDSPGKTISRRNFVAMTATGFVTTKLSAFPLHNLLTHNNKIKAILFDAFPIFDPRPVFVLAEKIFPGKGTELSNLWKSKQFEYCWLRTAGSQYTDFWKVTEDALVYAAKKAGIELSTENQQQLMNAYLRLDVWPDVIPALKLLKEQGIVLSFLSNMTSEMLSSCIKNSKTQEYFTHIISTDKVKSYKPSPASYRLGVETLNFKKEEILFVPFASWDTTGAKWFGYPTFWVNRSGTANEELGVVADGMGTKLDDLVDFVRQQ